MPQHSIETHRIAREETWPTRSQAARLLPAPTPLRLRQRINHLARLGIVQLFPRLVLNRIRIGLQFLNPHPQLRILLLKILDLSLQLMIFSALLLPHCSPCLPLITCHISNPASPTATTVPAGRHARCAKLGSCLRAGPAPAPTQASDALFTDCAFRSGIHPHLALKECDFTVIASSLSPYPLSFYPSTNFSAAARRASISFSLRASV